MLKKRQAAYLAPRGVKGADVSSRKNNYTPFYFLPEHYHEEAQLLFSTHGIMTVFIGSQIFVVPPNEAVWIPPKVIHSIQMSKKVIMKTLYFTAKLAKKMPKDCHVLSVSPFFRELIVYCCGLDTLRFSNKVQKPLIETVIHQVNSANEVSLSLVRPSEKRATFIANDILENPGSNISLNKLIKNVGASKRTIERIFLAETGLSLGKWRQQARLINGLKLITEGLSITQAALDSGYSSPSSFTVMFKKTLGVSPREYIEKQKPK